MSKKSQSAGEILINDWVSFRDTHTFLTQKSVNFLFPKENSFITHLSHV